MQEISASKAVLSGVGCNSPPSMRLAECVTALRAWCKQYLHGRGENTTCSVPGCKDMCGSMGVRLRPCVISSTPFPPWTSGGIDCKKSFPTSLLQYAPFSKMPQTQALPPPACSTCVLRPPVAAVNAFSYVACRGRRLISSCSSKERKRSSCECGDVGSRGPPSDSRIKQCFLVIGPRELK